MEVRRVNCVLLRKLVARSPLGKTQPEIAKALGISLSMLSSLMRGKYKFQVKDRYRLAICDGLKISEEEMFPLVEASGEQDAS